MRWTFQEWGASVVLSGHDHTYERILMGGFPYFVNSLVKIHLTRNKFSDKLPKSNYRLGDASDE